uniref:Uncharacterized protein n=2 Tax=Oryza TaxID=4527 RepID=A0A0E0HS57_ORYNI
MIKEEAACKLKLQDLGQCMHPSTKVSKDSDKMGLLMLNLLGLAALDHHEQYRKGNADNNNAGAGTRLSSARWDLARHGRRSKQSLRFGSMSIAWAAVCTSGTEANAAGKTSGPVSIAARTAST